MPKLRDYSCDCGNRFEYIHMNAEDVASCPACMRVMTADDEMLGGKSCKVIVPMSRTSLKNKAGYVHKYNEGRPAEKGSVAVPRTYGDSK